MLLAHFLFVVNYSFIPRGGFNINRGLYFLHKSGMQDWALWSEFVMLGAIVAAIIILTRKANSNQTVIEAERDGADRIDRQRIIDAINNPSWAHHRHPNEKET